jgi:hypothetical protein
MPYGLDNPRYTVDCSLDADTRRKFAAKVLDLPTILTPENRTYTQTSAEIIADLKRQIVEVRRLDALGYTHRSGQSPIPCCLPDDRGAYIPFSREDSHERHLHGIWDDMPVPSPVPMSHVAPQLLSKPWPKPLSPPKPGNHGPFINGVKQT